MKLHNIKDIEAFSDVINQCRGRVELVSAEGDRLNLKSKLTQYVALARIFSSDYIHELELDVELDEDKNLISKFMLGNTIAQIPFS